MHDPANQAHQGDTVEILPCRRISKTKSWRLVRVVRTGGQAYVEPAAPAQPPARFRESSVLRESSTPLALSRPGLWAVSKGGACETCFDTVARPDLLSTYGTLVPVELNRDDRAFPLTVRQMCGSLRLVVISDPLPRGAPRGSRRVPSQRSEE